MSRFVLILLASLSLVSFTNCQSTEDPVWQKFLEFAKENGRKFVDDVEQQAAFNSFRNSLAFLRNHQRLRGGANRPTFEVELNKFALMTPKELDRVTGAKRPPFDSPNDPQIPSFDSRVLAAPPASIDWVAKGAVTPPGDQGPCGSCWSFPATGALEAAIKIKTGILLNLSEENLIACDGSNDGCGGGWPPNSWNNYTKFNRLMTEKEYPYSKNPYPPQRNCSYNSQKTSQKYTTKGTIYVNKDQNPRTVGDEKILMAHVAVAPVSVAVSVRELSFHMYKSGVYYDPTCRNDTNSFNHVMLVVGYGYDVTTKLQYWKLRNSWGSDWGEGGYMRLKMGSNACGIANFGHRPVVNF